MWQYFLFLIFKINYSFAGCLCVFYLGSCTVSNITSDIDYKDFVCHIDLALVHVIKHFLGSIGPNLIIPRMAEKANADYYVSFQRQPLLYFQKSIFELCASA